MPITYDAVNKIITVTGYTVDVPCTFTDLYNADVAGSWGVVLRQGLRQFHISARIVIGNGSTATYFADTRVQVLFPAAAISNESQRYFYARTYGHIKLGLLINAAYHTTKYGCSLIFEDTVDWTGLYIIRGQQATESTVELYGCQLINLGVDAYLGNAGQFTLWNVTMSGILPYFATWNIYNLVITYLGTVFAYVSGTFNKIAVGFYVYGIYATTTYGVTVKNAEFSDLQVTGALFFGNNTSVNSYLINVISDSWVMNWLGNNTGRMFRQYEVDLKVTDTDGVALEGATVKLLDKDGAEVFSLTTAADGTVTQQTISRGFYDQAHGSTLQEYSPHTLRITKTGYQTYEEIFTLTIAINWTIALLAESAAPEIVSELVVEIASENSEIELESNAGVIELD